MLEKIKALCKQSNISVTELENILGFGRGTILNWNTSSPSTANLLKVANYFQVSLDYLVGIDTGSSAKAIQLAKKYDSLSVPKQTLVDHYMDVVGENE